MKLYRFELLFFDGTVKTGKFCVGVPLNIQSIYLSIFGDNQNRNRLNLSVAKYITHWFQRQLTASIRTMVKRLNKPFGGPDRFPPLTIYC